jgi:hypothetical protein
MLTLLLTVVGVYLMTDLDFFRKQAEEMKEIKEEIVQDLMKKLPHFRHHDVDEEEERNYLSKRLTRHQMVINSHTRGIKRGNSDPELNSMAVTRRRSFDSFNFDFDFSDSDNDFSKENTRQRQPANGSSPSKKVTSWSVPVGTDDSSSLNSHLVSCSCPISDCEDQEAPMNEVSHIDVSLPLQVFSDVEVDLPLEVSSKVEVDLSTNSHASHNSRTGTAGLSEDSTTQSDSPPSDGKENPIDQKMFNNEEISIHFSKDDDSSSWNTDDDDSEAILSA